MQDNYHRESEANLFVSSRTLLVCSPFSDLGKVFGFLLGWLEWSGVETFFAGLLVLFKAMPHSTDNGGVGKT